MCEVNWWLETYKLLPAFIIGLCVACVAFMQWRTAHAKVMVDLFEKRLEVYEDVRKALMLSNTDDGSHSQRREGQKLLFRARVHANFLYSEEIANIVIAILKCVSTQLTHERRLGSHGLTEDQRERFSQELMEASFLQDKLQRQFEDACIPYLRIDLKSGTYRQLFKHVCIALILIACFALIF